MVAVLTWLEFSAGIDLDETALEAQRRMDDVRRAAERLRAGEGEQMQAAPTATKQLCPACGVEISDEDQFCAACGTSLR
ncbi:zinc ribbon domain-containing protein [Candidatus Dactylopiibacterium carminicum]|nr:zinc ribbon domain-containing protein [Candidatus Dactylopiibacterium carminicum]